MWGKMDKRLMARVLDYTRYSDKQIHELIHGKIPTCDEHISALYELQRRRDCKEFWYRTVWSWGGFAVSLISLVFSAIALWHTLKK